VPADATVKVGEHVSMQKGAEHTFTTPVLERGFTYTYEVVVRWKEKDKEMTAKKTVEFQPGQVKTVDFTPPVKKSEDKKTDDKKVSDKKTDDKKVEDKKPADKKTEDKKVDDKKPVDKKTEDKKVEDKKITDKKTEDKKTEDKKSADKKTEDKKLEDKKLEDKKPADKKAEDKKSTDKKTEDKKTEDKKVDGKSAAAKSRTFLFTYAGRVTDLKPGEIARVWLPMPRSNGQQQVEVAEQRLPGRGQIGEDKEYGNSILYFEAKADEKGEVPFEVSYRIVRKEVKTDAKGALYVPGTANEKFERFLQPDAKVPVSGKPLDLVRDSLKDKPLPSEPFGTARVLYDIVNKHMTYKKVGTGWGQGDSVWACDSQFGNCTDFHSLFISMARGNKIASKFEMGFPVPQKHGSGPIGGYHCWAWFSPDGKGWVPVDISEANQHPDLTEYYFGNLSENRVGFCVGRDIELEPRQKGPPLNFFIYPYVEVQGAAHPSEKVQRTFSYKDVP
jgi:uncharacterized protein (TIGR03000 family)